MGGLKNVPIESIRPNPYRQLDKYPWIERKLVALEKSIQDVGMWEGMIARENGEGYELAFGHHRLKAAENLKLKTVPLFVKPLTDEQMLQYMGRENMDDYSQDFLIMLNGWEGALKYWHHGASASEIPEPIELARKLGWTRARNNAKTDRMNATAEACAAAYSLIQGGYLDRGDLEGLSTKAAREITTRATTTMQRMDKSHVDPARAFYAKQHIAIGAQTTARLVREGIVASRDIRGTVEAEAYRSARSARVKDPPLFAMFGKTLAHSIEKVLDTDVNAEKLKEMCKALNKITLEEEEEDQKMVALVYFQLGELKKRAERWHRKIGAGMKKEKKTTLNKALSEVGGTVNKALTKRKSAKAIANTGPAGVENFDAKVLAKTGT